MSIYDMTRRAFLAAATSTAVLTGCATGNPKPNTARGGAAKTVTQ